MSKEKVQISPVQFTFLFITMVISTADLFIPSFVAQEAKQDSWISAIVSVLAMVPILFIYISLYKNHSGKSLIEMCTEIAGKYVGGVIGFLYVFYFAFIANGVIVGLAMVMKITFLPITPPWVIVIISIVVSLYGVSKDIEVIARINEILLPAGIGALGFLIVLNINGFDFSFFRPVLARGVLQPIRGAIVILGSFCETIVTLQIAHFLSKPDKISKSMFLGLLITGIGILVGTLIYAVFGPLTEMFLIPSLEFARFSSIGKYIQNLDILILAIWITGIYVKSMIFLYSASYAMSQLFRFKNYKSIIFPLSFLLCSLVITGLGEEARELYFMHYIFPLYAVTMSAVIPGILLVISVFKNKSGEKNREKNKK